MKAMSIAAVALVLLTAALAAEMRHTMAGDLRIERAWTRATPAGAPVGGGYLTITNTGENDDRLLAASTDRAGKTEIHEMAMADGVMTMRHLGDGLPIPAGETVELAPSGLHLMFLQLAEGIAQGETIAVTLTFEKAGTVSIDMAAAPIGATAPMAPMMDHPVDE